MADIHILNPNAKPQPKADAYTILDVFMADLSGYDRGFQDAIALKSTQSLTESDQDSGVPSPILIDETRWQAAMDEIRAIIISPYTGQAEIGFDPINQISLALVKHMNLLPVTESEGEDQDQSAAAA